MRLLGVVAAAAVLASGAARAGTLSPEDGGADYVPAPHARDIVIVTPGERSARNIALVAGLAGGAAVLGGIGLYFHLDSKSAADKVSADSLTGQVWTPALRDSYDRAHRSGVAAGVFYGVGGALLVASIVTLIVTEPRSEKTIIHPHGTGTPTPTFAIGPDGAVVGGAWRF